MEKQRYEGRDNCESLIVGIIPSDNCPFYSGTRLSTALSQLCPQRDQGQGELWSLKRHLLLKWPFQTSTREKKDLIFTAILAVFYLGNWSILCICTCGPDSER